MAVGGPDRGARAAEGILSDCGLFRTIPPPKNGTSRGARVPRLVRRTCWLLMIDYEIQRCTRHCAETGRELQPGETFYSTLTSEGSEVVRRDYSVEAWQGPPPGVLGWWKSLMPQRDARKMRFAPNDVMLDLLESLESQPDGQDMRYVLSLLLIRRRVVRLEETEQDSSGGEISVLYCPRRETTYRVATVTPGAERTAEIQEELSRLLFADAG